MKFYGFFVVLLSAVSVSLNGYGKMSPGTVIAESSLEETLIQAEVDSKQPFKVLIDKNALESRQEEQVTVTILSDSKSWEYDAEAENGKISNKTSNSFDYNRPKENILEDTITIHFTDKDAAKSYQYTIPLVLGRPTGYKYLSSDNLI
ncbi:MAG: hypothetical protein Q4E89_09660 [Eubacteriales bacterium]|nr:hypothetical protein [Eubacteriales bacterium]